MRVISALLMLTGILAQAESLTDKVTVEPRKEIKKIEDNSFLIEEAYNQEHRVVQHIQSFQVYKDQWQYVFTQEWPIFGRKHQFSFGIPFQRVDTQSGLSDLQLNYRYQLVDEKNVALAPRFTVLAPTGDWKKGLGYGAPGYQVNLPVSVELNDYFVAHFNIGATYAPNAYSTAGTRNSPASFQYGASLVWLARENFNFLVELLGTTEQKVQDDGSLSTENNYYVNPGIRYAINVSNDFQVVPGISVPVKINNAGRTIGIFGYLSFEHAY